mmetsp:Transcript_23422/g.49465  ORF Transcript_23422/g.49465 Transcript_23422/m.49465 type:complete len:501 (+) Transcript_23422:445-1947(+)
MSRQTIRNPPMKRLRRLHRRIDIDQIMTLNISLLVIDRRIDNPIPHGLGHHKLRRRRRRQTQPHRHILQRYPRITRLQPPQPRLDHRMRQPGNQGKRPIQPKTIGMPSHSGMEHRQISPTDGLGDFKVGFQFPLHSLGEEDGAVGDFSHEELDDDEEALHGDPKSECGVRGGFAEALGEVGEGGGVFEAEGLDTSGVVEVAEELVVGGGFVGEGGVGEEFLSLFNLISIQKIPQHQIHNRRANIRISPQTSHPMPGRQFHPLLGNQPRLLRDIRQTLHGQASITQQTRLQGVQSPRPGQEAGKSLLGGRSAAYHDRGGIIDLTFFQMSVEDHEGLFAELVGFDKERGPPLDADGEGEEPGFRFAGGGDKVVFARSGGGGWVHVHFDVVFSRRGILGPVGGVIGRRDDRRLSTLLLGTESHEDVPPGGAATAGIQEDEGRVGDIGEGGSASSARRRSQPLLQNFGRVDALSHGDGAGCGWFGGVVVGGIGGRASSSAVEAF